MNASTLVARVKDYPSLTYWMQARLTDSENSGSTEIQELYVTAQTCAGLTLAGGNVSTAIANAFATAGVTTVNVTGNAVIDSSLNIPDGRTVGVAGNLTVNTGATLTVGAGAGTARVFVGGALTINGTLNAAGKLTVAGTTIINGNSLVLQTGAKVDLQGDVTANGKVVVPAGTVLHTKSLTINASAQNVNLAGTVITEGAFTNKSEDTTITGTVTAKGGATFEETPKNGVGAYTNVMTPTGKVTTTGDAKADNGGNDTATSGTYGIAADTKPIMIAIG